MRIAQAVKSHFHPSRRQLLSAATGVAGMLFTTGSGRQALAQSTAAPKPIPGGVTNSGVFIHHFPPVLGNEPSQITDFDGLVATTRITGAGTGTDGSGVSSRLAFQVDMGIMKGVYVGADEQPHLGSFGFIWMDLFEGGQVDPTRQVHDYSPGIPASGLFWTIPMPTDNAQIDLGGATASLSASLISMPDAHDVANGLKGGPSVPATVSFNINWAGVRKRFWIRDEENGFTGNFIETFGTAEWSSQQDKFQFVSDPAETSKNVFAVLGRERNGRFFNQ